MPHSTLASTGHGDHLGLCVHRPDAESFFASLAHDVLCVVDLELAPSTPSALQSLSTPVPASVNPDALLHSIFNPQARPWCYWSDPCVASWSDPRSAAYGAKHW